jgi:TM2 domain-containing membrane protein YozV
MTHSIAAVCRRVRIVAPAVLLTALFVAPRAGAQRGGPRPDGPPNGGNALGYKDPQLATVLGLLVPGGGQIYAGRSVKGGVLLSLSIAAPLVGILGSMALDGHRGGRDQEIALSSTSAFSGGFNDPRFGRGRGDRQFWPVAAGFGVSIASWAYGWATAAPDARHQNGKHGLQRFGALVEPLPQGRTGVGMTLSLP